MVNWRRSWQPAFVVVAFIAWPGCGAEPLPKPEHAARPDALDRLLKLTPQNTESLFCVNAKFAVTERDDLTITSLFETASYLTTVLGARLEAAAGIHIPEARCAVSAVREIELPKPDPRTHICSGLFRAKRCELIMTAEKLPPDRFAPPGEAAAANVEIAGYQVTEIGNGDEKILVVQLAPDLVCVSNDKLFLAEALALASGRTSVSIDNVPAFSAARQLISKSAPFWSIRLFPDEPKDGDPTSVQNPESVLGFHDPKAVFIAMEFPQADSKIFQIHYASQAGREATDRFASSILGKMVQKSRLEEATGAPNHEPQYVINSLTCDLSLSDLNHYDDNPVLPFAVVIAVVLGQGLLL